MNNADRIAELLPDGLSEATLSEIFTLVDSTINDQVDSRINLLEAKVNAFLRSKIDSLKEQAISELSEESEVFRNARLFESVRTLMSLELTDSDEESALSEMTNQQSELQEEFDVLTEQLNNIIIENDKLENTIKVLSSKTSLTEESLLDLEEENSVLQDEVRNLEALKEEAFVSSEKAIVVSKADNNINEEKTHRNEFLTDEVMKFMPFNSNA